MLAVAGSEVCNVTSYPERAAFVLLRRCCRSRRSSLWMMNNCECCSWVIFFSQFDDAVSLAVPLPSAYPPRRFFGCTTHVRVGTMAS